MAAVKSKSYAIGFISILIISTRQYALVILIHEAVHFNLSRRKNLNDLISNLLLAFPLLVSTEMYRRHHLAHHKLLHSDSDPDLNDRMPKMSGKDLFVKVMKDITGINFINSVRSSSSFSIIGRLIKTKFDVTIKENLLFIVFFIAGLSFIIYLKLFFIVLLFWFVPMMTFFAAIYRFNAMVEHSDCDFSVEYGSSRNINVGILEENLIAPHGKSLHLTHHLYPGIPFFKLKNASSELLKDPEFREKACINNSYFFGPQSFLKQIIKR